jgi:7,8-dihydro-6-hydroxymethylpterin dimethyltransferase
MDRFNFCVGGVKRSCIHFVTPERKIIPFDTYNLFYRPGAAGNAALARAQAATPVRVGREQRTEAALV